MAGASPEARSQLRWRLADECSGPQQALFEDEPPTWRAGHGEFRGLEFLEVKAQRVINPVPPQSRMSFRYTINAYRGCSHACSYCQSGDTPILMADGRTKPLADLRVGDRVYGTERRGTYRHYVITDVLDHWSVVKPAYRISLEDGTELIASGDHRYLTDRGWKHVTGTECGRHRRPHLTINNKLLGTGAFVAAPEHDTDYRLGYLTGMIRGDGHVGSYEYRRPRRTKAVGGHQAMYGIRNQTMAGVDAITQLIAWPAARSDSWCKGFLAGIFDAEGSYLRGILRISNADLTIVETIESCLQRFGVPYVRERPRDNGVACIRIVGGLRHHLQFFQLVDPAITRKRSIEGIAIKGDAPLKVKSIEPLGLELPLYDITTGTGDFIANGVVSHNCFARPTHEYLNLDTGRDFERRIVVKINAVERVRAEVQAKRWAGDLIAMGTNTDPYQRCEGKYRLTRGIVEVLGEARNPFSILTKSTLILRDIDVLAEAARRTRVQTAFSVGTVDDEVWKLSEPGTPHPMRRLEALARLREAGIATGVLAAPILPGISDSPRQLQALADALVEAGVESASPIVLHLRPGVKQEYLSWLADVRPDLLERYDQIYGRRSYAPKAIQAEITARFRAAFDAARRGVTGREASPRDDRR
ncbi:MAG: radical SAM protein [Actinomycetota bacterium]|jgi:DNA repair photolyase